MWKTLKEYIIMIKKLKFDHTNKWYKHNTESVLENETHKLLKDFEIQTDHLISARQPDILMVNKTKRTYLTVDFAVPSDHWVKLKGSEKKKKGKYLDLARELKKTTEHESDGNTNCNRCARYRHQSIGKKSGGIWNKTTSGDRPNYCTVKIGQNTEKSPGDLRKTIG